MSVRTWHKPYWHCICDNCGKNELIAKTKDLYNGAQAIRSLGWSFTKDRKTYCKKCRMEQWNDNYKWLK